MASYDRVAKVVAPKRIALAEAEAAFATVDAELKSKQVRGAMQGFIWVPANTWADLLSSIPDQSSV
jgi:hypothetical protein